MAAASPARPHRAKVRIPPGPAARAAAHALTSTEHAAAPAVVIDLARYAAAAAGRNTLQ